MHRCDAHASRTRTKAVDAAIIRPVGFEVVEVMKVRVAELRRCSDGVIEIHMDQGSRVSVDEMEEILEAQWSITPAMAGVLVDARGTLATSREALERVANNPVNDRTAATALLVDSPVSTLLVNFFIRFGRPPYPARAFRDPDEARRWLLEHLAERV